MNNCESQIKIISILLIFFAKIYPLLTHIRKTPPLRSHYAASLSLVSCYIVANYLDPFSSVIEQAINVLLISWSPWVASGPGVTFSLARA